MIRQEIIKLLEKATGAKDVHLERPENPEHGDYSTNIALKLKSSAQEIVSKLKSPIFEKVEAAGPGFINLYLSENHILKELNRALRGFSLTSPTWKGKKVAVEFTDPNPFKEFHIGHLYSNIVGETICRLLETSGATVKRANYQGDVGLHVAKAIWGMMSPNNEEKRPINGTLSEKIKYMAGAYGLGHVSYTTDGKMGLEDEGRIRQEIEEINKLIYSRSNDEINKLYDWGRKASLEYFERIYKRLGTKFDFYYFESDVGKIGKKIVEENLKKGIFEKSEGAVVFPGEKYGLHKRVFITSEGLQTYEAKELGLAPVKYKDFPYDISIIVTGSEITDYFKVVIAALKTIYPELGKKTLHIAHGMVRLRSGKMSSRTGEIIRGEDLLDEVKNKVAEKNKGKDVAEKVALAAVKYSFLRVGLGRDIIFDIDASLNIEGDSGPYLQYTHARFKSILRKVSSGIKNIPASVKMSLLEKRLASSILRFPEAVEDAANSFSPNTLVNYLRDTAMLANEFYHSHPVSQEKDKSKRQFRVGLAELTTATMKQGLNILGIFAPEKM